MIRLWKTALAAAALASISGQALALSCAKPDVRQSFNWWADAPEPYYISVGTLIAAEPLPKVPRFDGTNQDLQPVSAEYRFVGEVLWTDRTYPLDRPVTVTVSCGGPWCGSFPNAKLPKLMALQVAEDGGLSVRVGPCGPSFFDASYGPMIQECLRAGRCPGPVPN